MSTAITMKVIRPGRPLWFVPLKKEQAAARVQLKGLGFLFHGNYCKGKCWLDKAGMPAMVWWTDSPEAAGALREYATPEALQALDGQEQAEAASRATDADIDVPAPRGLAYLPYQRAGIAWILGRLCAGQSRVLLGDEQGTGKTIQLLGVINGDEAIKSVLIIVPASLRINWRREAQKWLTRRSTVVIAESAKDVPDIWTGDLVVICNYDKLLGGACANATVVAACRTAADRIDDGGKPTIQGKAWAALNEQPLPAGLKVRGKVRKTLSGMDAIDEVVRRLRAYGSGPSLHDVLMERHWDLVAADESQRAKNEKAQQTVAVLGSFPKRKDDERLSGIVDQSDRFVFMTGTPITNRIKDIWTTVRTMAPDTLGRNFFAFAKRYCDATHDGYGWDFSGSSNLGELQQRLRTENGGYMIRRIKADVLTELPPKRRQVLALSADGATELVSQINESTVSFDEQIAALEAEKLMAQCEMNIVAYDKAVLAMEKFVGASFEEFAGLRAALGVAKAHSAAEHIRDMLDGGLDKVVVFAHHKEVVRILMNELADYGPVQLTGDTPMDERQHSVDRFQKDPTCRVFVGNMQAAGVGITLTAASTVVFAELDWTPANILQAEDRCHRIGQNDHVLVQHLVLDGSLDQRMAELIVQKMDAADQALDRQKKAAAEGIVLDATEVEWMRHEPNGDGEQPRVKRPEYVPAQVRRAREGSDTRVVDMTSERKQAIQQAIQILSSVCDGAMSEDGVGFSRCWVKAGKWLASLPELGDAEAQAAYGACCLFRRQLPSKMREAIGIS